MGLVRNFFVVFCFFIAGCGVPEKRAPGRIVYRDDFDKDLSNWVVEQAPGGTVELSDGRLCIDGAKGCTVWFRKKLYSPVMIEYEAVVVQRGGPNDRGSDLNCFWMAQDPDSCDDIFAGSRKRGGRFKDYDLLRLYYVGYGVHDNSATRFRRYPGTGKKPLLPQHDLRDEKYLLECNKIIKIRLIADGNKISYLRDGQVVFDIFDPAPFTDGWFGFRTFHNHMMIDNFRVYAVDSL